MTERHSIRPIRQTRAELSAQPAAEETPMTADTTAELRRGLDEGFLLRNWSVIDVYGRIERLASVRREALQRLDVPARQDPAA